MKVALKLLVSLSLRLFKFILSFGTYLILSILSEKEDEEEEDDEDFLLFSFLLNLALRPEL